MAGRSKVAPEIHENTRGSLPRISEDVCKWKMTDTKKLMPYETSCGNDDLYDNSYKYCPYCGKKIKVVE